MSTSVDWTGIGKAGHVVLRKGVRAGNWLRAFVETGSNSNCVLGSFSEVRGPAPRCVFFGTRNYGSDDGILITVFYDEAIPDDVELHLTVVQLNASKYDDPIPYAGD